MTTKSEALRMLANSGIGFYTTDGPEIYITWPGHRWTDMGAVITPTDLKKLADKLESEASDE